MEGMQLPIDVVPGTNPPIFHWRQNVDTPNGRQSVEYREALPATLEVAMQRLITITKQLAFDNAALQGQVRGMADRIASQSDQLSKVAEKAVTKVAPPSKGRG